MAAGGQSAGRRSLPAAIGGFPGTLLPASGPPRAGGQSPARAELRGGVGRRGGAGRWCRARSGEARQAGGGGAGGRTRRRSRELRRPLRRRLPLPAARRGFRWWSARGSVAGAMAVRGGAEAGARSGGGSGGPLRVRRTSSLLLPCRCGGVSSGVAGPRAASGEAPRGVRSRGGAMRRGGPRATWFSGGGTGSTLNLECAAVALPCGKSSLPCPQCGQPHVRERVPARCSHAAA